MWKGCLKKQQLSIEFTMTTGWKDKYIYALSMEQPIKIIARRVTNYIDY